MIAQSKAEPLFPPKVTQYRPSHRRTRAQQLMIMGPNVCHTRPRSQHNHISTTAGQQQLSLADFQLFSRKPAASVAVAPGERVQRARGRTHAYHISVLPTSLSWYRACIIYTRTISPIVFETHVTRALRPHSRTLDARYTRARGAVRGPPPGVIDVLRSGSARREYRGAETPAPPRAAAGTTCSPQQPPAAHVL